MACGVPVVCSAAGENSRLVTDGMCGFLVETPDEWLMALRRVVDDKDLRRQIGQAGRTRTQVAYSCEIVAGLWHTLLSAKAIDDNSGH